MDGCAPRSRGSRRRHGALKLAARSSEPRDARSPAGLEASLLSWICSAFGTRIDGRQTFHRWFDEDLPLPIETGWGPAVDGMKRLGRRAHRHRTPHSGHCRESTIASTRFRPPTRPGPKPPLGLIVPPLPLRIQVARLPLPLRGGAVAADQRIFTPIASPSSVGIIVARNRPPPASFSAKTRSARTDGSPSSALAGSWM